MVIGLGYVGLPLAIEFGKKFSVVGYDTDLNKIKEINARIVSNWGESKANLLEVKKSTSQTQHRISRIVTVL